MVFESHIILNFPSRKMRKALENIVRCYIHLTCFSYLFEIVHNKFGDSVSLL